jgi:mono/diheme cytochrome c family protein
MSRFTVLLALSLLSGCMQKMAHQPKMPPLRGSAFFDDGRSARPLVPGTVARGHLDDDVEFYTGRKKDAAETDPASLASYVDEFPLPLTSQLLERGRERFNIFCAVCHDRAGTGNGTVVRRGYTHPPSYHTDHSRGLGRRGTKVLLRYTPVGYYFDVITNGYGAMPDYSSQVPPRDRWAIVAYIRALQISRGGEGALRKPGGEEK